MTKIGERTAIKAARESLADRQTNEMKLAKAAKDLGLESVLAKHLGHCPVTSSDPAAK